MQRILLATTLLLSLTGPAMAGQIFKWVDSNGTTHYGTQPPQGQQATSINPIVAPKRSAPVTSAPLPVETIDEEQTAINEKVKAEIKENSKQIAEYCTTSRSNLAQLENNPRVRTEINGEMRRLTEEERQEKIAETQKLIKENCL